MKIKIKHLKKLIENVLLNEQFDKWWFTGTLRVIHDPFLPLGSFEGELETNKYLNARGITIKNADIKTKKKLANEELDLTIEIEGHYSPNNIKYQTLLKYVKKTPEETIKYFIKETLQNDIGVHTRKFGIKINQVMKVK